MRLRVVRRTARQPGTPLGTNLHPVLGRVYAARGVRSLTELDTSLARLLPVGTLEGTAAAVELLLAHRAAGRVLITDHHLQGAELPDANVIVNPNLEGSRFGSRALAGVGVAFYVVAALARRLEELGLASAATAAAAQLLDLVALGTVADMVPLDANNRVLVAQGLKRIRAGRCTAGIRALLAVADRAGPELSAADLGFAVAPRLNAAGRLDDMSIGIRCLLADDAGGAGELAARLDELNQERRAIEARMQQEALGAVRALSDPQPGAPQRSGVCLFDASWHQGVVGLVAGRVAERLRRPVIAFAVADESTLRGSARSVAGIHIRDVLALVAARHPDLIHRFGGHAMAAGLTLERARLDRFARAFDEEVARWSAGAGARDAIETDGELAPEEIALDTAQALRAGGPWGQAFPEPCFDGLFSIRSARLIGARHVKMWVEVARGGRAFDAIAFNHLVEGEQFAPPAGMAQLVYRLAVNEYQGERRLQLLIDHLLPADHAPTAAR
ncbi:MAG: single-stranded-DNA-specific exonuclease RecJ [Gammaproteobacteria bacterium]|nr:MAG: single-stranded-DNA-specific exonuclease RecJ [Gammaproteobacteria bacterium]